MSETGILCARGLEKVFGYNRALKSIDLIIRSGEFWVFFGPNGAGKTTLTGILATLLKPSSGALSVGGIPVEKADENFRRMIGMVSHQTFLYSDLTAHENLLFYGKLYDVSGVSEKVRRSLKEVGLHRWANERVRNFSRGMQQRLAIARALLHEPAVLLLDEPYSGLDRHAVRNFQKLLQSLHAEDRTIVLTTHDIRLGLNLCTHVAVIVRGRIIFKAPRADLDAENFEDFYLDHIEERI